MFICFDCRFANSVVRNCRPIMRAMCYRVIYKCKIGVFRRKRSINTGHAQGEIIIDRYNVTKITFMRDLHNKYSTLCE